MLLEQMGGQAEGLNRLILKSYLKKYLYCFEKGVKTWKCSITQTVLLFFGEMIFLPNRVLQNLADILKNHLVLGWGFG